MLLQISGMKLTYRNTITQIDKKERKLKETCADSLSAGVAFLMNFIKMKIVINVVF